MKNPMTKLRRNVRALSPIFAVLILISIAVIGGIVVYLFTSGYLGGMTGGGGTGQEKVSIQAIQVGSAAEGTVTLYVKSTGGGDVSITEAVLKSSAGTTLEVNDITDVVAPANGTLTTVLCDFDTALSPGSSYSVTLISHEGSQFVSTSFKA